MIKIEALWEVRNSELFTKKCKFPPKKAMTDNFYPSVGLYWKRKKTPLRGEVFPCVSTAIEGK